MPVWGSSWGSLQCSGRPSPQAMWPPCVYKLSASEGPYPNSVIRKGHQSRWYPHTSLFAKVSKGIQNGTYVKLYWLYWKLREMFELRKRMSISPRLCFKKPLETHEISRCLQAIFELPTSKSWKVPKQPQNQSPNSVPTNLLQINCKICWKHQIRCSAKLSLVKREREGESIIRKQQLFPFSSLPHSNCALHCIALCIVVHCWGVSVVEALPVINIIPALSLFPPPACSYWLHSCSLHSCCSYWLLTSPCHSTALKWKCHEHQLVHCCPDCCNAL